MRRGHDRIVLRNVTYSKIRERRCVSGADRNLCGGRGAILLPAATIRWRSTPAGFISARRPQKFLNIRLNQAKPDISVELLAPLVQHEARTAFNPHLVSVLVVRSQPRECVTIVNALLDSYDIDAMGFCYLTLNVSARNVPAVSEKRTAEIPQYLIENAPRIRRSCHSINVVPLLDCFHEQM